MLTQEKREVKEVGKGIWLIGYYKSERMKLPTLLLFQVYSRETTKRTPNRARLLIGPLDNKEFPLELRWHTLNARRCVYGTYYPNPLMLRVLSNYTSRALDRYSTSKYFISLAGDLDQVFERLDSLMWRGLVSPFFESIEHLKTILLLKSLHKT